MVSAAPRFWLCIASVDQSGRIIEVRSNGNDNKESRTWSQICTKLLDSGSKTSDPDLMTKHYSSA